MSIWLPDVAVLVLSFCGGTPPQKCQELAEPFIFWEPQLLLPRTSESEAPPSQGLRRVLRISLPHPSCPFLEGVLYY